MSTVTEATPRKTMREMTAELTHDQRLHIAERWLGRAGLPNKRADQEALAPKVFACRSGSAVDQMATQFLKEGRELDPKAVVEASRAARAAQDVRLVEVEAPILVAFLRDYWAEHGAGPKWAVVGKHMGWRSRECEHNLHLLRSKGVVTFTTEPGSLNASS